MMQRMLVLNLLILLYYFEPCSGQTALSTLCKSATKCGRCLQIPGCVWCADPKFTREKKNYDRCNTKAGHSTQCTKLVEQPKLPVSESIPRSQPNPNRPKSITSGDYNVELSTGQKVNITLDYVDAGNKPLDLYYLMDLSATMKPSKDAVSKLGADFATALKETTTNLKMGFGSFVDKPMMPYATLFQISQPWTSENRPPYGFDNQLKLTLVEQTSKEFEDKVKQAKISFNLDAPEGVLDAMMQVMECWDEIGWRDEAHRLLVVSTDGTFHIAGDGKLGGLVIPNDGKCHMENNSYAGTKEFDYPSISQIISKIREKKIYVIFAVLNQVFDLYSRLSSLVNEYAVTIRIDSRSLDVADLVKQQYRKIRSGVQLSATPIEGTELTYFAKCDANPNSPYIRSDRCDNLVPGAKISFKIQIELRKCPENPQAWNQKMNITPTGSSESLLVNMNLKCDCDCERKDDQDKQRTDCTNGKGSLRCGICSCNPDSTGEFCQCDKGSTDFVDNSKCYRDNSVEACGGRGECSCGQCQCKEPFSGEFCECDKTRCTCASSLHGKCICEKCECDEGYSGPNCDCSESKFCTKNGKVCSGNGRCACNKCDCNSKDFTGKYCQICQTCQCLEASVLCAIKKHNKTTVIELDNYAGHCINETTTNFTITELSPNLSIRNEDEERSCSAEFEGCRLEYIFKYSLQDQRFLVRVNNTLNCPKPTSPPNPLPIILGTIGSVLFFGILTLILWKIITYCLDKHEFEKFEKECRDGKWDVGGNPLYVEATSTFRNPAYTD